MFLAVVYPALTRSRCGAPEALRLALLYVQRQSDSGSGILSGNVIKDENKKVFFQSS